MGRRVLLPTGLHTRRHHLAENHAFLERDVGDDLLPGWPRVLQKKAVATVARQMHGYLPRTGVVPRQHAMLDRWTERQLDALDAHFAAQPFLFGSRPSLGDFGQMGPLYGHLGRDPWPARHLIAPRPHVRSWIERMNRTQPPPGEFLADDAVPATLDPLLDSLLGETLPYLEGTLRAVQPALASRATLPRFMDDVDAVAALRLAHRGGLCASPGSLKGNDS